MGTQERLRVIVTGQMGQYPLGGVTWFYIQYILGLKMLGHDVWYFEDSGQWPYSPTTEGLTKKWFANIEYLKGVMERFGLADKWAYCFPGNREWYGVSDFRREDVLESADLLLNVSGTLDRPEKYRQVRRLVFLDTDPVFNQAKLARGQGDFIAQVDAHDLQFSYAECPAPGFPETGHNWRPTRVPVVLSEWHTGMPYRETYTTVMNWTSHNSVEYNGRTFGQKDIEFQHYMDLPGRVAPVQLELAVGPGHGDRTPHQTLKEKGWILVNPNEVCPDLDAFRTYTESSKAEWSVAKNGYVQGQPGWFSERSARYLAAGRPVVVQDTGFSRVLPTGFGIVPFTNLEEAVEGIRSVESDYTRHSRAAREIAEEYFDAAKVLGKLVAEAMNCSA